MPLPKVVTCYDVTAGTSSPTVMSTAFGGVRGLVVVVDITAGTSLSLVFTIQGYDPVSNKFYTILASAALTGTGTTVLRVFPGADASANVVANDIIPARWRVLSAHGNGNAATYKVSCHILN